MRTMWKGAISFGLVSIPVRMYPATEPKSLKFNQLHSKDHGRIKMKRTCSVDGEEVPFDEIVKGYEIEKDQYVVMEDEDFEKVPVESSRAIDIEQFVNIDEIDPIYYQKTYYLAPEETGLKAYHLLREALGQGGKVGIAKVAFREKEHLAAIRLKDNMIVLETMYWPDEIRKPEFEELDKTVKVKEQEVQMAETLIENLTDDWKPEAFKDEYREALLDIVEKKAAGEEIEVIAGDEPKKVVDLMEALKASVEATTSKGKASSGAAKKSSAKSSSTRKKAKAS